MGSESACKSTYKISAGGCGASSTFFALFTNLLRGTFTTGRALAIRCSKYSEVVIGLTFTPMLVCMDAVAFTAEGGGATIFPLESNNTFMVYLAPLTIKVKTMAYRNEQGRVSWVEVD